MFDEKNASALIVYGIGSGDFYRKRKKWLEEKKERQLFFIEDDLEAVSRLAETEMGKEILTSSQVEVCTWESPLSLEPILKKIAWKTVFQPCALASLPSYKKGKKEKWAQIEKLSASLFLGVQLVASDYSDFGVKIFDNLYRNLLMGKPWRSASHLQGAFEGIPAVICGAGPSLKKNGHLLSKLSSKALLFAGGSALNVLESLGITPSFAAAIDKEAPLEVFKRQSFWETPFFFQGRISHENFSLVHGEPLFVSDSGGYPLEKWLYQQLSLEEEAVDGGWNVATLLIRLAILLGCSPIILVGMDLAFSEKASYAKGEGLTQKDPHGLIPCQDLSGKEVLTQKDWLMAAKWIEKTAEEAKSPLINCTEGGLGFGNKVPNLTLQEVEKQLERSYDLKGLVHQALVSCPKKEISSPRVLQALSRIEKSLFLTDVLCDEALLELEKAFQEEPFEEYEEKLKEELVYTELLLPLWEIWKWILQRGVEKNKIAQEIHRLLFFKQVMEEHTQMIRGLTR